ncbi:MAG: acetylglutamate kinase [Actinobacteria bacterium]|nr:acetylglutamate kinase [Actinomycetota bacterium]
MIETLHKAEVLTQALPYIKEYHGKTVVIKYGGSAMQEDALKRMIITDLVLMRFVGINPVVVHGGGPEISRFMEAMGKQVEFVDGLRVTDEETMELVEMVLVGKINKEIVSLLNSHGNLAVGLSGADAQLLVARKIGDPDLGYVGEVEKVNTKILIDLISEGFIPVIATVGVGTDNKSYNINADKAAGEIAAALDADKIIFLTDVDGLYRDFGETSRQLIPELTLRDADKMLADKMIGEGMIPKVEGCVTAIRSGVKRAHILNGTINHALLLEIFTDEGVGTMIGA